MGDITRTGAVSTESGLVQGLCGVDGIASFKGLPFAVSPVGRSRWCGPAPVGPWNGIYNADRYGSAPLQPLLPGDAFMRQFSFAQPPECGVSENCLSLNIWKPADAGASDRLPVIVWIFGGGMRVGSASHPVSDGSRLARKGAIVVSVNYRLSGLGFLAHPALTAEAGVSGNYACHDILAALHWIQRNIKAFGGDPDAVTLFGQSAGAALISVLMASPLSKDLFHRVIAHSGGRFGHMKTLASAEQEGQAFMESLGATTAESMRRLAGDTLYGPRGSFGPIVDGHVLHKPVSEIFATGAQMKVPVLCGYTRDEAAAYSSPHQTSESFAAHVRHAHAGIADELLRHYPHANEEEARASSFALRRDSTFAYQAWSLARAHCNHAPTYLFNFSRALPLPPDFIAAERPPAGGFGAYHGAELWYAFDNLSHFRGVWTSPDEHLAQTMSTLWVEFARTGKPGQDWPNFAPDTPVAMNFDTRIEIQQPFNIVALKVLSRP